MRSLPCPPLFLEFLISKMSHEFNGSALIAILFVFCFIATNLVAAHGDMKEIFVGEVDDYKIAVSVLPHQPMVGHAHFTIEPTDVKTSNPIEEAIITIIVRHGDEAFESRAVNSPSSTTMYDANLTFYEEGDWEAEVKIQTLPDHESSVFFIVNVSGESIVSGTSAGYFFLFIFGILVVVPIILVLRYRRANKTV